jgi:hypothetical protein
MARKDRDDDHDDDRDDDQKRHIAKMPNRKYGFFRDDEVTFLVTHDQDQVSDEQLEEFERAIGPRLQEQGVGIRKLEVISFPRFPAQEYEQCRAFLSKQEARRSQSAFSIIKCDLENQPRDPARLVELVEALNQQLPPEQRDDGGLDERFTLEGTSLNWLTSIAAEGSGTGGPGGKPSPYTGSRKNAPYCFDIRKQLEGARGGSIYGDGSGVDVVILDTAPSAQALVSAYKEWTDHPLISTLLGPRGKLHLYPASYDELLRIRCTSLNEHDYRMTDHGLFIAGIIHSIVPEAEIHLIEVLNQYGVGDLISFTRGLQIARKQILEKRPKCVVNCSWFLEFPREDRHYRLADCVEKREADFVKKIHTFSKTDKITRRMLEYLFNQFFLWGKQAVAAAGNDGRKEDKDRVQARYPAALKWVSGAGALPRDLPQDGSNLKKYLPSVFSNLSESPNSKGVVTQGVLTLGGEEGEGKGVLGLYIGEFPGCCRNDSKWAWWSGTSFAAPILTATIASVLSRPGNNVNTTQEAVRKLYGTGAKIIKDGKGHKQEDALPVKQS